LRVEQCHGKMQMHARAAVLSLIIALPACASAPPAPAASAPAELDRDEAAVYAVVIDSVFAADGAPFVVVGDSTVRVFAGDFAQVVRRLDPGFPASSIADFEVRNRTPVSIPANLPARTPIRTLRLASFGPPGGLEEAYAKFRSDFAPARQFYLLSRPGIDSERRHAVIATGSNCGSLCGRGEVLLLARDAHGWHVTARTRTWVS
jgi:hypothetical protein